MKILILSSDKKAHLDVAFCNALLDIGHEAQILNPFARLNPLLFRLFLKCPPLCVYPLGFGNKLAKVIQNWCPDIIILWRPVLIKKSLLLKIKEIGCPIHIINNDDPFSSIYLASNLDHWVHLRFRWYHYKLILPLCSWCWFYRPITLINYIQMYNKKNCQLFPPYYIETMHNRRFDLDNKIVDVTFAGHFEPDGRDTTLLTLIDNGFKVRVYGPQSEWQNSSLKFKYDIASITTLAPDDYADTLNKSKISLCFLSKINRDGYTRRCLEIPASGSVLVAERTEILESLFTDRKEAFFFDNINELLFIIKHLCQDNALLASATIAGQSRLLKLGLESKDIASLFIEASEFNYDSEEINPLFCQLFTKSELDLYRKSCQNA